jgi:peptidoglycan/LPS O-acetylase OafA/YrhL|tara:strand:- start:11185 stop:11952 length:768 start_codon:yes stop_codon:yes gene_type:complete
MRALVLAPSHEEMPFPLGQIWYLRVLLFCTLVCPIIFIASRVSTYLLLLGVLPGLILSSVQTIYPIHSNFFWLGHNIFQEIVYGAYFFLGAFISTANWRQNKLLIFAIACAIVLVAIITFPLTNRSYVLGDHAYAPDTFYFLLGIFGILVVLSLAPLFEWFYNNFKPVDLLLKYCGKHSYGIYLSHSFFIIFTEIAFGWKGVYSQPMLALAKILFVVSASMLAAYPLTLASKAILARLKSNSRDSKFRLNKHVSK